LAEVGDALSRPLDRLKFLTLLDAIDQDPSFGVVSADDELFHQSIEFFRDRPDKEWTFTDCTSFVVMENLGIREALTADVHFEQAGFVALLKE
jgi:predicted nucleic acid-binding protein